MEGGRYTRELSANDFSLIPAITRISDQEERPRMTWIRKKGYVPIALQPNCESTQLRLYQLVSISMDESPSSVRITEEFVPEDIIGVRASGWSQSH